MGFFDGIDNYNISQPLTFAAWDDYVGTGHVDPAIQRPDPRPDSRLYASGISG